MLIAFIIGLILAIPAAIILVTVQQARAETVDCPHCGKTFKLTGGSLKCPKCRTRVTRTSDGRLITS